MRRLLTIIATAVLAVGILAPDSPAEAWPSGCWNQKINSVHVHGTCSYADSNDRFVLYGTCWHANQQFTRTVTDTGTYAGEYLHIFCPTSVPGWAFVSWGMWRYETGG